MQIDYRYATEQLLSFCLKNPSKPSCLWLTFDVKFNYYSSKTLNYPLSWNIVGTNELFSSAASFCSFCFYGRGSFKRLTVSLLEKLLCSEFGDKGIWKLPFLVGTNIGNFDSCQIGFVIEEISEYTIWKRFLELYYFLLLSLNRWRNMLKQ